MNFVSVAVALAVTPSRRKGEHTLCFGAQSSFGWARVQTLERTLWERLVRVAVIRLLTHRDENLFVHTLHCRETFHSFLCLSTSYPNRPCGRTFSQVTSNRSPQVNPVFHIFSNRNLENDSYLPSIGSSLHCHDHSFLSAPPVRHRSPIAMTRGHHPSTPTSLVPVKPRS